MKPRARRGCTQAAGGQTQRYGANALTPRRTTRSGRRGRSHGIHWPGGAASHKAGYRRTSHKRRPSLPRPARGRSKTLKRNTQEWQGLRAVYDSRDPCSEKGPFLARSSRYAFPKGDLRGFSDAWRAYLAKASSFWMHGGNMLPGRGAFPVRGRFWDA